MAGSLQCLKYCSWSSNVGNNSCQFCLYLKKKNQRTVLWMGFHYGQTSLFLLFQWHLWCCKYLILSVGVMKIEVSNTTQGSTGRRVGKLELTLLWALRIRNITTASLFLPVQGADYPFSACWRHLCSRYLCLEGWRELQINLCLSNVLSGNPTVNCHM